MAKAKAGTLKEKIDRVKKKLAEGKDKMEGPRARVLRKRLKRSQRARRKILASEARRKVKTAPAKAEEAKEGAAPASS
jgi:hypothetical protein